MKLEFTVSAALDLESISDWIAQDNPKRALSFVQELKLACIGLVDFPLSQPLVPRYEARGIRRKVHGGYLIFYTVNADVVTIVHILNGAQDYEAVLFF